MGGVHQEEIYFINHEFKTYKEVESAQDYLGNNEPVCCSSDWWDKELTLTGFDSKYSAESFYKDLINYVDNPRSHC